MDRNSFRDAIRWTSNSVSECLMTRSVRHFDRLLEKRCGVVWERVGSKRCVESAAHEEKRVDLANESRKEVRWVERAEVGDERVRRLGNV